jgi:GNAT superfamily N-acetyltransferase
MAGPTVRRATEADVPRLLELLVQLGPEREEPGATETYRTAFREIARDPRQQILVVEAGARIVGTAVLIVIANLSHQGRPWAVVENVVVDERERGSGHGALLMRHAVEEATRAGCYKLSLTSNKRRTDAHRFYKRLGFQATHEGFRIDL